MQLIDKICVCRLDVGSPPCISLIMFTKELCILIYLFRWKSPKVLPASDQWKLYSTHSSSWWWRGLWSFSTQLGWSPAGKNQNQIVLLHVTLIIERIGTLKIVLQNKRLKKFFLQLHEESQYQSSFRQLDSFYQIGLFRLVRKPIDSEQKLKFI